MLPPWVGGGWKIYVYVETEMNLTADQRTVRRCHMAADELTEFANKNTLFRLNYSLIFSTSTQAAACWGGPEYWRFSFTLLERFEAKNLA